MPHASVAMPAERSSTRAASWAVWAGVPLAFALSLWGAVIRAPWSDESATARFVRYDVETFVSVLTVEQDAVHGTY